jgi:hypothetical protein
MVSWNQAQEERRMAAKKAARKKAVKEQVRYGFDDKERARRIKRYRRRLLGE